MAQSKEYSVTEDRTAFLNGLNTLTWLSRNQRASLTELQEEGATVREAARRIMHLANPSERDEIIGTVQQMATPLAQVGGVILLMAHRGRRPFNPQERPPPGGRGKKN